MTTLIRSRGPHRWLSKRKVALNIFPFKPQFVMPHHGRFSALFHLKASVILYSFIHSFIQSNNQYSSLTNHSRGMLLRINSKLAKPIKIFFQIVSVMFAGKN